MRVSMHQPDYLPWLPYFNKIARSDVFIFFDTAFYSHSGFHDSNKIKTAEGWAYLTIPVAHTEDKKRLSEARLPEDTRWAKKHWRSLEVHYGRAPFWKDHSPFFEELYSNMQRFKTLSDFNIHIIEYLCRSFGLDTTLKRASVIGVDSELRSTEAILQIIKKEGAKSFLAGPSGKEYLDRKRFEEEKIDLVFQEYNEKEHRQLFPPFISGLSAIDLLFNEGSDSNEYLTSV